MLGPVPGKTKRTSALGTKCLFRELHRGHILCKGLAAVDAIDEQLGRANSQAFQRLLDSRQTNSVGIVHGSSTNLVYNGSGGFITVTNIMSTADDVYLREIVAVDVADVDVTGSLRHSFIQNFEALIDHWHKQHVLDLLL